MMEPSRNHEHSLGTQKRRDLVGWPSIHRLTATSLPTFGKVKQPGLLPIEVARFWRIDEEHI
jgi:hypothetical protein